MALVKKCDRCGKLFVETEKNKQTKGEINGY